MIRSVRAVVITIALSLGFASVIITAQEVRRPIMLGGYSKVATDNPEVQEAADFAVNTQGEKQSTNIKLTSIDNAERQSASGSNFRLCLTVEIEGENDEDNVSQQVKVVVHRNLQQEHSLTSWEEADCGQ